MIDLINIHARARAVHAAAELGLADLVQAGQNTDRLLATELGAEVGRVRRLMRALVGLGIFSRAEDRYALTESGSLLRSDAPDTLHNLALMNSRAFRLWAGLPETMRTGTPGTTAVTGGTFFEFVAEEPGFAEIYDKAMNELFWTDTRALTGAYDFGAHKLLMDAGGGNGDTIAAILHAYPHLRGCLLDLPHVAERAMARLAAADLYDRCKVVGGSFFDALPAGADAILLRQVIHDWTDTDAVRILKRCREAIEPDGSVLIAGTLIEDAEKFTPAMRLDLAMMTYFDAGERSVDDYRQLLDQAGLCLKAVIEVNPVLGIVVAVPE